MREDKKLQEERKGQLICTGKRTDSEGTGGSPGCERGKMGGILK